MNVMRAISVMRVWRVMRVLRVLRVLPKGIYAHNERKARSRLTTSQG